MAISFAIQIFGEFLDGLIDNFKFLFFVNIIISYLLDLLDSIFSDKIKSLLINNSNSWSYSDIKFYSILFQSIFKFINKGIFPLLTYYCFPDKDKDYSDLVSKMFVIIEMDGFGYPMIDWLYSIILTKGKDMYESTQKMMTLENIEKEISDKIVNKEGLSRKELEQAYEKKEMDIEGNYSDILSIYWITMFYLSIYPIGIIQSFLNLLFKFIIEKNFLLNTYKRPEYINPHFGFLCFNFFNFGFFLFLLGDIIFFKNKDNAKSFGSGYIIIMLLILLIPFYFLAKLIMHYTNYCYLKKKESENINDDIKQRIKKRYKIFNPYYLKKKKIIKIFKEYYNNNLLTYSQYEEIIDKIKNKLNYLDLYKIQQKMRIPKLMTFEERKLTTEFIYQNNSILVQNKEKENLYYLLMEFGFISYLEEGNALKQRKKRIEIVQNEKINSTSLRSLSMIENLSNCDSGYFTILNDKKELIMAYIDNEINVKIFDVFHRRVLNNIKDLKDKKKIICVDYYLIDDVKYLISIVLDNTMIISDLSKNNNDTNKIIQNIGDTFDSNKNKPNNIFSLSTVSNQGVIWIITSYYYDRYFKIYNSDGECLYNSKEKNGEIGYIISLEGLCYTNENSYICVRSRFPDGIYLFINQFLIAKLDLEYIPPNINPANINPENINLVYEIPVKINSVKININNIDLVPSTEHDNLDNSLIYNNSNNKYHHLNFKIIKPKKLNDKIIYIIITKLNFSRDSTTNDEIPLKSYIIGILDISRIFPFYEKLITKYIGWYPKNSINNEVNIPMNEEIRHNIINNNPEYLKTLFPVNFEANISEEQIADMENFFKSDNNEKYNIGNILFWEDVYIIVGTPFNYLDIINLKQRQKVGIINTNAENISDFRIYNISERIYDDEYGLSFIMRDNKGKIQYVRSARITDKLNYKIMKSNDYFNDLEDDEKLTHILFSTKFYFIYSLVSYFIPLITAIVGHVNHKDQPDNSNYITCFIYYVFYAIFGIWFKGCVYDIKDESHTQRICTYIMIFYLLLYKIYANSKFAFIYCQGNKSGIIFISMLFGIYFIHLFLNFIIYIYKIKFLLRTYWLGFLFYQLHISFFHFNNLYHTNIIKN